MRKERKKRTGKLAELYAKADGLLADMGSSVITGLKKEANHKTSPRKREAEKKEVER